MDTFIKYNSAMRATDEGWRFVAAVSSRTTYAEASTACNLRRYLWLQSDLDNRTPLANPWRTTTTSDFAVRVCVARFYLHTSLRKDETYNQMLYAAVWAQSCVSISSFQAETHRFLVRSLLAMKYEQTAQLRMRNLAIAEAIASCREGTFHVRQIMRWLQPCPLVTIGRSMLATSLRMGKKRVSLTKGIVTTSVYTI